MTNPGVEKSVVLTFAFLLSACWPRYGYFESLEVGLANPEHDVATAIDIARAVAERWDMWAGDVDGYNSNEALAGREFLVAYGGFYRTSPRLGYSTVNVFFTLSRDPETGDLSFDVHDIDNGRQTHIGTEILASIRDLVEKRLTDAEVGYESGRTELSFFAP